MVLFFAPGGRPILLPVLLSFGASVVSSFGASKVPSFGGRPRPRWTVGPSFLAILTPVTEPGWSDETFGEGLGCEAEGVREGWSGFC